MDFKKQKLFTTRGIKTVGDIKRLYKQNLNETVFFTELETIIGTMDSELSTKTEELRQYKQCYGESHDWWNAGLERIRIAKQALEEAEERYKEARSEGWA
jgi:hypothetical protein